MRGLRCFTKFALCLTLVGCSDVFRPSYDYAHVRVSAVDLEGQPVPAVRLTLYTGAIHLEYGLTRADGTYTFRFVPAGGYGVEAGPPDDYTFPEGALPYRIVEVEQGDRAAIDFTFRER